MDRRQRRAPPPYPIRSRRTRPAHGMPPRAARSPGRPARPAARCCGAMRRRPEGSRPKPAGKRFSRGFAGNRHQRRTVVGRTDPVVRRPRRRHRRQQLPVDRHHRAHPVTAERAGRRVVRQLGHGVEPLHLLRDPVADRHQPGQRQEPDPGLLRVARLRRRPGHLHPDHLRSPGLQQPAVQHRRRLVLRRQLRQPGRCRQARRLHDDAGRRVARNDARPAPGRRLDRQQRLREFGRGAWIAAGSAGGAANVAFSTGTFAQQASWSNDTNDCATSSGLTATFTDTSTDAENNISTHRWTFGDGAISTATNPSHAYAAAGTYRSAKRSPTAAAWAAPRRCP